jgi:hypothetical protein
LRFQPDSGVLHDGIANSYSGQERWQLRTIVPRSRNSGETAGTPFCFELRENIPLHDGRVGTATGTGKVWHHISGLRVPIWESQKLALDVLFKNSTVAPEKCKMAVRLGKKNDLAYE